jgi:hypothetical protein
MNLIFNEEVFSFFLECTLLFDKYYISTKVTQKFQKYKFSAIKRLKIIWKKGSAAWGKESTII